MSHAAHCGRVVAVRHAARGQRRLLGALLASWAGLVAAARERRELLHSATRLADRRLSRRFLLAWSDAIARARAQSMRRLVGAFWEGPLGGRLWVPGPVRVEGVGRPALPLMPPLPSLPSPCAARWAISPP